MYGCACQCAQQRERHNNSSSRILCYQAPSTTSTVYVLCTYMREIARVNNIHR